jgi:outer membrane lipoprotein-sorting protein
MTLRLVWALCLAPLIAGSAFGQTTEPEAAAIIKKIDDLYRSDASHGKLEMEIVTSHWQRTLTMEVWTEKLEKTFIRILEPAKERGVATLRIGTEMWNYLPKTNKVIKIPPSMMMSSWMGSDFTNDDLVKEYTFLDDYHFHLVTPDDAKEGELYIECIPKEGRPIVWSRVLIAVNADNDLPLWQKYYNERNQLMRTLRYGDVRTFGKRRIPAEMEMVPENKEGSRTTVRYLELEFDVSLPSEIFSLRNLRSRP